jgi:hypothetical protein
MQLKIEPTSELSLKLGDKKIGRVEGLYIDVANSASVFMAIPKVKIAISVNANAFENSGKLKELVDKVSKFKFLDLTIIK